MILITLSILGKTTEIIHVEAIYPKVIMKFSVFENSSFLRTISTNYCLTGFQAIGNATKIDPITPHIANKIGMSF